MYPLSKYKFYRQGNKVIAVSTYAGRTVRGVAKCDESDSFDLEKGKQLAAARCAQKIAFKRFQRAEQKLDEAQSAVWDAEDYRDRMDSYYGDAEDALEEIDAYIEDLLNRF